MIKQIVNFIMENPSCCQQINENIEQAINFVNKRCKQNISTLLGRPDNDGNSLFETKRALMSLKATVPDAFEQSLEDFESDTVVADVAKQLWDELLHQDKQRRNNSKMSN